MVVGKPYIHFTINNEPLEVEADYNYTWATTVEATKGPINQPVLISSAAQAQALFGVDMRPYFAQGAESLIMVRVADPTALNKPQKGVFSFLTKEDIVIQRVVQAELKLYDFSSYSSAESSATKFTDGIVQETGKVIAADDGTLYTEVEVKENPNYTEFEGQKFYISSEAGLDGNRYELYTDAGQTSANLFVTINKKYTHKLYYCIDTSNNKHPLIQYRNTDGILVPESYMKVEDATPRGLAKANNIETFSSDKVLPYYTTETYKIPARTPLFSVTTKYEGDYGITVSVRDSVKADDSIDEDINSYDIILTDPSLGTIRMNNAYDVVKIVNRINDRGFNFVAKASDAGLFVSQAMESTPIFVSADSSIVGYPSIIVRTDKNGDDIGDKKYSMREGDFIVQQEGTKVKSYSMNLTPVVNQYLSGSSNGEWDIEANRIPKEGDYRKNAHATGLKMLRRLRIAGVFCMYGDDVIKNEYVEHGKNSIEPEKGMNNNETCKWRTILLGASESDRQAKSTLSAPAATLNDQYTLFLGQGLIDTGFDGVAAGKTPAEKRLLGVHNDHQLLPYECTQYIAGLRSKLSYDESIFGGQGRKRIRSIGDLEIAPLFDYEEEYEWDPKTYTYLNENGVLTFTEEYGNITLTDGVTTCQTGYEEDEEGVMNILKYAQNSVYNVCLPYIGRNINSDLEQSITMDIQNVLETMKNGHQSIVDTDEYQAYTVNVSLGARKNQLLGRIYVYLTITPAHALRQIEVEMTVQ